jgi:hypothetical protein
MVKERLRQDHKMTSGPFRQPDFGGRHIELRCKGDEVAMYMTEAGLRRVMEFCKTLLDDPSIGHIHLEDYELLTANSLRGAIAVFRSGD